MLVADTKAILYFSPLQAEDSEEEVAEALEEAAEGLVGEVEGLVGGEEVLEGEVVVVLAGVEVALVGEVEEEGVEEGDIQTGTESSNKCQFLMVFLFFKSYVQK